MTVTYYKNLKDDHIISLSTGSGQVQISKADYDYILNLVRHCPTPPEGYGYWLNNADLTWELYELPPEPILED